MPSINGVLAAIGNQLSAPVMMHGIAAHPVTALPGWFAITLKFIIALELFFREQLPCTNVSQQMR